MDPAGDQGGPVLSVILLPPLLLLLLLLPPLLLLLARRRRVGGPSSPRCRLPPSPPGLPLLGNLHQVGSCPHRSFASLSRVHGPVMLLHLGQRPTVVVSSPATAMEILKTHDLVFARRPQGEVAKKVFYGCTDVSFSPYGDHWKKLRKICALHLLGGRKARSYQLVREEEVSAMIDKVERHHTYSDRGGVDVRELLHDFMIDLVTRVIHGRCFREQGRLNRVFGELMEDHMALMTGFNLGEFFPSLGWLSLLTGLDRKAGIIHRKWDRALDDLIADHLRRRRSPEDDEAAGELQPEETPFMDVLLALRDDPDDELSLTTDSIKSLVIDMLSAGTETAYITMEWVMAELIRNSDAMERAQAEIRRIVGTSRAVGEGDVSGMSYLRAVISETLRLHPPAPLLLPREASEDARVGGYDIPRQTTVMVNAWAIMRDPDFWDAPEEFRPERFLDSALDWQGGHFHFIPFGGGRRVCPGIQFAVPTMALALANLLHRFDWQLPPGLKELDMADKSEATTYRKHRLFLVPIPKHDGGGGGVVSCAQ